MSPPPPPPPPPPHPPPLSSSSVAAQGHGDRGNRYTIIQRVHCLALQAEGNSWREIERKTGVKQSGQSYIKKRARDRGFRPEEDPRIYERYVEDGPRSGRPKKIDLAATELIVPDRQSQTGSIDEESIDNTVDRNPIQITT